MSNPSYSIDEMRTLGSKPPTKGHFCTKYGEIVPVLDFLNESEVERIRQMAIQGKAPEAIDYLMKEVGCSRLWATLIVVHQKCPITDHVVV